mgnify:CR=1 FL=1
MKIAVLAVQGAFAEHRKKIEDLGIECMELRKKEDLMKPFDGLILPGGESTVQGKLLKELDMYQILKQKQCYFLTNRIEEPLEQRFIREVTRTERCDTFESGMEKLRNIKTAEQYPVLFIDHNNYQEICEYKERIRVYAMENPKTEIILRYPLFNMVERLDFQKKTNRNLNQFTV